MVDQAYKAAPLPQPTRLGIKYLKAVFDLCVGGVVFAWPFEILPYLLQKAAPWIALGVHSLDLSYAISLVFAFVSMVVWGVLNALPFIVSLHYLLKGKCGIAMLFGIAIAAYFYFLLSYPLI